MLSRTVGVGVCAGPESSKPSPRAPVLVVQRASGDFAGVLIDLAQLTTADPRTAGMRLSKIEHSENWSQALPLSISVCIPTRNPDLAFLTALIESVKASTLEGVELVLSDDGSSDPASIRRLLDDCSLPWTMVYADQAIGMAANWNRSVEHARAGYVLVTGQDDLLVSANLAPAVEAARRAQADLVFSAPRYVDSAGAVSANPSRSASAAHALGSLHGDTPSRQSLSTAALLYGNVLGDPCHTFFSTSLFKEVGGFSSHYEHAVDLQLWLRMLSTDLVALRLSYELGAHRQHTAAATATHVRDGSAQRDRLRLLQDFGADLSLPAWNRAVARLHTHRLNDKLRHSTPMQRIPARMRGGVLARIPAYADEALETFGLRTPALTRYIDAPDLGGR